MAEADNGGSSRPQALDEARAPAPDSTPAGGGASDELRLRAEQTLEETRRRLEVQSATLTELTATHARRSVEFGERLRAILESCAHTLAVERVSVWQFSADRTAILCVDLFEA